MSISKHVIFLYIVLIVQAIYAQKPQKVIKSESQLRFKLVKPDCNEAVNISLGAVSIYGPTYPPKGYGIQEIKKNKQIFEEEHNSAWYLLSIGSDGILVFDIAPIDTANDYDFLLYAYTDTNFCTKFNKTQLRLLRSNLSNTSRSSKGITGLKETSARALVPKGAGDSHSKFINVKKGEKYMLVLDNVSSDGKGHKIYFDILRNVEINGITLNSDSVPVVAEISLYDENGTLKEAVKSNKQGVYTIHTSIKEKKDYNLTISSDSSFFETKQINTKDLKDNKAFPEIKSILIKLKKGAKYKMGNINFYGDVDILLPVSYPSVEAFYQIMKKNEKMVILIEGHTNGNDWYLEPKYQSGIEKKLSESRAKRIYDYLLSKGIEASRMSTVGLGSTVPVHMNPVGENQASENRRVEIKVITLNGD